MSDCARTIEEAVAKMGGLDILVRPPCHVCGLHHNLKHPVDVLIRQSTDARERPTLSSPSIYCFMKEETAVCTTGAPHGIVTRLCDQVNSGGVWTDAMLSEPLGEKAFLDGLTMHVITVARLIEEAIPHLSKNKVLGSRVGM